MSRWLIPIYLGAIGFFISSCKEIDPKEMKQYAEMADSLSVETALNVQIKYTDSAILKALINAPVLKNHPTAAEPFMEMPEGLDATFYDASGTKESFLSANYGINYSEKNIILLRNKVRVTNEKGEELQSEELYWDQALKKIYTNKAVKIIRGDEVLYGKGLESNENFTKYRILNPVGEFEVKEE